MLHLFSYKVAEIINCTNPYGKNLTCPSHWSHIIINKLYVCYTRKDSKDSVTYRLYLDITAELNVVYIHY